MIDFHQLKVPLPGAASTQHQHCQRRRVVLWTAASLPEPEEPRRSSIVSAVGCDKPPSRTRFCKGVSGNPGRAFMDLAAKSRDEFVETGVGPELASLVNTSAKEICGSTPCNCGSVPTYVQPAQSRSDNRRLRPAIAEDARSTKGATLSTQSQRVLLRLVGQ